MKILKCIGPNLEIAGLRLEILGLIVLICAALWQAEVNDWFSKNATEGALIAQHSLADHTLYAIDRIGGILVTEDVTARLEMREALRESTNNSIDYANYFYESREKLNKGQATSLGFIRQILAIAGSLLIVLGKYLVSVHKRSLLG